MTNTKAKRKRNRKKKKKVNTKNLFDTDDIGKKIIKDIKVKEEQKQSTKEYIDTALNEAKRIWKDLKSKAKDKVFMALPDEEKSKIYTGKYKEFAQEFPIVFRYMVCMGQYKKRAFHRYLLKVKNFKPPTDRSKDYMEDQWVRRQADYLRYLWEEYVGRGYDNREAKRIWESAYNSLKKEFTDFRDLHAKVEEDLRRQKKKNKTELVSELMGRLSRGEQSIDNDKMAQLVEVMQTQLLRQRKSKTLKELLETSTVVEPCVEGLGTYVPPPLPNPDDPTESDNIEMKTQ